MIKKLSAILLTLSLLTSLVALIRLLLMDATGYIAAAWLSMFVVLGVADLFFTVLFAFLIKKKLIDSEKNEIALIVSSIIFVINSLWMLEVVVDL